MIVFSGSLMIKQNSGGRMVKHFWTVYSNSRRSLIFSKSILWIYLRYSTL